ncbi:hypothetical protein [Thiomicrorhabdus indica]|uniref:hypothetical protein n=1 Tax=Thiomicrorhabdus indica TaxID=2267253 RepID=UPI00102DEC9E|nr:hypothetical protein [Thiomicrorhabdus indica]
MIESEQDCENETAERQSQLKSDHHKKSQILADTLERCFLEALPCGSLACPICNRNRRLQEVEYLVDLIGCSQKEFRFVTLIYYKFAMTSKAFYKWKISSFKRAVIRNLEDSGFTGIAIGNIEFDFHEQLQLWLPHIHLIMTYQPDAFKELRRRLKEDKNINTRDDVVDRPMVVKVINSPIKVSTYCLKISPMRVLYYVNSNGKRMTGKYRLRDPEAALAYVKLNRTKPSEMTLKFGVRKNLL